MKLTTWHIWFMQMNERTIAMGMPITENAQMIIVKKRPGETAGAPNRLV